jgi:transposase
MAYILGEGRNQGTLFPVVLDDLVPSNHVCRVIDAFVEKLDMAQLGFERAEPAGTGRPGYDPRALLKLYLYGYLNQLRSSRRLEAECRRNLELMWLLERLYPDYKSIAEFRRMHQEGVTAAGAELVRLAKSCGLIRGEWIAIDGSKFRAVASIDSARERFQLQRYLDSMEKADSEQPAEVDASGVQAALDKLNQHPEPEANFMLMRGATAPAYNVQTAVDAEHSVIVTHAVVLDAADNRQLQPMVEAAARMLEVESFHVAADAGYSNGKQAAECEEKGFELHIPTARNVHTRSGGLLYSREYFQYQVASDTYTCPAGKTLRRKRTRPNELDIVYRAASSDCSTCSLKLNCTLAAQRSVSRHFHEETLLRMQERATPAAMRLRRSTVEHPFATMKYRIFGHPRLLLRGLKGARIEIGLATMAYNLKRMVQVAGTTTLIGAIQKS